MAAAKNMPGNAVASGDDQGWQRREQAKGLRVLAELVGMAGLPVLSWTLSASGAIEGTARHFNGEPAADWQAWVKALGMPDHQRPAEPQPYGVVRWEADWNPGRRWAVPVRISVYVYTADPEDQGGEGR